MSHHPGSINYRVGLIIANAQPFHNGLIKIIGDALMKVDELIISFIHYDEQYFNYEFNRKMGLKIYGENKNISYFGTKYEPLVRTPKQIIEHTLNELKKAKYNYPTHFFTHKEELVTPAMEEQLIVKHISTLVDCNTSILLDDILNDENNWEDRVPYMIINDVKTYIATKRRQEWFSYKENKGSDENKINKGKK